MPHSGWYKSVIMAPLSLTQPFLLPLQHLHMELKHVHHLTNCVLPVVHNYTCWWFFLFFFNNFPKKVAEKWPNGFRAVSVSTAYAVPSALLLINLFVFQAQMVRSMLSRVPAERPEASEITETPLFQELEVPCRIRQRSRTYSTSSTGRPSRQMSGSS